MGQKVNPIANRLGYIRGWESNWFEKPKKFAEKLHQDNLIRAYIYTQIPKRIISRVVTERAFETIAITIHTSRPGILIGPGGKRIQELKEGIKKKFGEDVQINASEVKNPDLDARLVAASIAEQIEARVSYKRAGKRAVDNTARVGAGIKVRISGRLNGAEIARMEEYKQGRVPCHQLCADIDYACDEAITTYGKIGIKVWIFRGEVHGKRDLSLNAESVNTKKRGKSNSFRRK